MASIKAFLESLGSSTERRIGEKVSCADLEQLFPIRNLNQEILQSFAEDNYLELISAGATLFTANTAADCAIYLLKGIVDLTDQNGKSYAIEAGGPQAKFPLCSGNKHTTTAIALTELSILRVSPQIMSATNRTEHAALEIPAALDNNRLLALFADHYQTHTLEIPSLPEVAVRLRRAIQKDVDIKDAIKIIELDPAITAKLIEVANCPLYLSAVPARNPLDAVNRIGLNGTRNLVIAISIKQIFKSRSSLIKTHLETLWRQSLYLAALCQVLATASQEKNLEDALLAGLIADIGAIPFLSYVANLPPEFISETEIQEALPIVTGVVGSVILKEWQFADEFIDVALNSRNWFQNNSAELSLTDIVVLSRLHAMIGKKSSVELPAITSIPAASKLKKIALSPENTLSILHDAKAKIHEALNIFSS
jgi:HD-like signal output (HDOD) protein